MQTKVDPQANSGQLQQSDKVAAQAALVAQGKAHLTNNYRQAPIAMVRGEGVWLEDVAGKRYLDMSAGIAVTLLGHAHPELTRAIAEQASRFLHCSNLYYVEPQVRLASRLAELSALQRAFFCNSGAEANEAALKLARRYQQTIAKAPSRIEIISCDSSFHGRTMAAVSVTGQEKYRQGFGPMLEPVRFVPYGDIGALGSVISEKTTCAFILEVVQGEGGIRVAPPGYLRAVRELCSKTGTILIFDEVQTGIGRTGHWFGFQGAEHFAPAPYRADDAVTPDIMTLAKGLAGGVPIGAMLCSDEVGRGFEPATHASTFGGNALACTAALTVLDVVEREGLLGRVVDLGNHLGAGLEKLAKKHAPRAVEARGKGLLRGLALAGDAVPVVAACRERGLLLSVAGGNVVRFSPPFVATTGDLDRALTILDEVLSGGSDLR